MPPFPWGPLVILGAHQSGPHHHHHHHFAIAAFLPPTFPLSPLPHSLGPPDFLPLPTPNPGPP